MGLIKMYLQMLQDIEDRTVAEVGKLPSKEMQVKLVNLAWRETEKALYVLYQESPKPPHFEMVFRWKYSQLFNEMKAEQEGGKS